MSYTPEEFAKSLKNRGYFCHIADARRYVEKTKKEFFEEKDFEEAYYYLNRRPIGRDIVREFCEDEYIYYKRDQYGNYWRKEEREI